MSWIVIGEDNGLIKLVSKTQEDGLLPKGSYLTIENGQTKSILRVEKSAQSEPYSPSPMIIDMDLSGLAQDQKCQNLIHGFRVLDISTRTDGKIDFIPPQSVARRSNQAEIDQAMGLAANGPRVFAATVHAGQNQLLVDDDSNYITAKLPEEMFYHQMLICGKTGSGKTVATKYLAQYFAEELEGAVLAINVKDVDFLKMNRASTSHDESILKEWDLMGNQPHGIQNFIVYYPASSDITAYYGLDLEFCKPMTLNVHEIEPEALIGLLQGISDAGALNLPDIFRCWLERYATEKSTFNDFVSYFVDVGEDGRRFEAMNSRGDVSDIPLHPATLANVERALYSATPFFDNIDALAINETDILSSGKMSVINVGNDGMRFGSVMLRHLLRKITQAKSLGKSQIPILIVIDEVHNFYDTSASKEALGDLDTICRQGRSQRIGVIFSSQNPGDIPRGLESVINTKIFFRSDGSVKPTVKISVEELESLKKGYAVATIHDLPKLKTLKFPLAYSGVFD